MSQHLPRATSFRKAMASVFFMLTIALITIGLTTTGSLASEGSFNDPVSEPQAIIKPQASSYDYMVSPRFDIETGSNTYFKVELALAKVILTETANQDSSGDDQNFYSSGWILCSSDDDENLSVASMNGEEGCKTTYEFPMETWINLRGSVVFYRVLTNSSESETGATISSVTKDTYVKRTGETWYGLPLNDQAKVYSSKTSKSYSVIIDGKLQGIAVESDYGPRNVSKGSRFHPGLDISVPMRTPVYAIADGEVVNDPGKSTVHRLDIKHLGGTQNEYLSSSMHLDSWVVSKDEEVKAGQLIAYSGDYYERVTIGAHLHFEAGFQSDDKYHNPLNYIPYLNKHTIPNGREIFIGDSNTNNHAVDVQESKTQNIVLIGFGVTTFYDKDLNYVKVQVDKSTADKWFFLLNYNNVYYDPKNGEVTMDNENGKKFRIRPMDYQIYSDTNLKDLFIVKADSTYGGTHAKDYFFLPWDVSTLAENSGHHSVVISVAEVGKEKDPKTHTVTIGPDIFAFGSTATQIEMTLDLVVTNYDIPEIEDGVIKLKVEGLPVGWSASLSDENPSIEEGQSETITLTLTANPPYAINADAMRENNTRVVATFGRIEALKDNYVICPQDPENQVSSTAAASSSVSGGSGDFCPTEPAKPTILKPADDDKVPANKVYEVEVLAPGAASDAQAFLDVDDLTDRSLETLFDFTQVGDTFTFRWTPEEIDHEYSLVARVNGFEKDSDAVTVTAVNDEVIFIQPVDMSEIIVGEDVTITLKAPEGAKDVYLSINPTDGGSGGWMTQAAGDSWKWEGWAPKIIGTPYSLTAVVHMPDGSTTSGFITVNVIPDDSTIVVPSEVKIDDNITVIVKAKSADRVDLEANGESLSAISHDDTEWKFSWKPKAAGLYLLSGVVYYDNGDVQYPEKNVTVIDESQNLVTVKIVRPLNGDDDIELGKDTSVKIYYVYAQYAKVVLEITDKDGEVKTYTREDPDGLLQSVTFSWIPAKLGKHQLKAYAWDADGNKGWTDPPVIVTVVNPLPPESPGERIPINEWSFLWKNKDPIPANLYEGHKDLDGDWVPPKFFDTWIPYGSYTCGIVGISVHGGDIGEENNGQIIQAYLPAEESRREGSWQLMLDFQTYNWEGGLTKGIGGDRPETWDVQILCIDRSKVAVGGPDPNKKIFFQRFSDLGDDVGGSGRDVNTGIRHDEYICGIVGFDSYRGDIEEDHDGNIILTYLFRRNEEWHIRADFRSQNGQLEDWDIDVLCVSTEWAVLNSSPVTGKPFVLKEYSDLGDNITYTTEFGVDDWTCGVVGFAARDGDIDEGNKGTDENLILVYMSPGSQKWHIRADFRTHNDHESWDVNVLCVHKNLSAPPVLSARPKLFKTRSEHSGHLYGPGMRLEWTDTYHPDAVYYKIQYSEDGGATWHIYNDHRDISYGGWINHHGNFECGHGFYHCLKPKQEYSYQVRVLDRNKEELTDWSNVVTVTSTDWPANVELSEPQPAGPYRPDSWTIIRLETYDIHGPGLELKWTFQTYLDAEYEVVSGCTRVDRTCTIKIRRASPVASAQGSAKLAALAPEPAVYVTLTGTDHWSENLSYVDSAEVRLYFKSNSDDDDDEMTSQTFSDVPPEHWAYDYIEYLSDLQITSGCTTEGEAAYCPEEALERSAMAVFTVRSRHPEEPGYVPPAPEKVVFMDGVVEPLSSVTSTSPEQPVREVKFWHDKYSQELYDGGVISGCSTEPLLFCPDEPTTRAQMTVLAVRILRGQDYTPPEPDDQIFNDVSLFDANGNRIWSAKWIDQATNDGLVQTCGTDTTNDLFRPEDPVTRAEAACMMYYALEGQAE